MSPDRPARSETTGVGGSLLLSGEQLPVDGGRLGNTVTPFSMSPLTRRQQQLLDFIRREQELGGVAPTLTEIARHFGFRSLSLLDSAKCEQGGAMWPFHPECQARGAANAG